MHMRTLPKGDKLSIGYRNNWCVVWRRHSISPIGLVGRKTWYNVSMKEINGYENYAVSRLGEVLNTKTGRYLKPFFSPLGYLRVQLFKDKVGKQIMVHRLVAGAYTPNPSNYPFVNHKDSNKQNNTLENLEWCTASQNTVHAINAGRHITGKLRKLTPERINEIIRLRRQGLSTTKIAEVMNVSQSCIAQFVNGKTYKNYR